MKTRDWNYIIAHFQQALQTSGGARELKKPQKLHGLSPRANYTNRATTACLQS
jgi:hypothetical protein